MFAMSDKEGVIHLFQVDLIAKRLKQGFRFIEEVRLPEINCTHKIEGRKLTDYIRVQKELREKVIKELKRRDAIIAKLEKVHNQYKGAGYK